MTDINSNNIAILLGNGDGTFQGEQFYSTNNFPSKIVSADFNQNGKMDLAVIDFYSHDVGIFINTTPYPVVRGISFFNTESIN